MIAAGADINIRNASGSPLVHWLESATGGLHPLVDRLEMLAAIVEMGADLHALERDGASILIGPIIDQNISTLEWFLAQGVDPNRGCSESFETVLDFAFFDYCCETERPAGERLMEFKISEKADADIWLHCLDAEALRSGQRRPDCLFLLRRRGALSGFELARQLGGDVSEPIVWRDDRWQLVRS